MTTNDCEFKHIGPLGGEPMDIWRCLTHRYNFFHRRGHKPTICPRAKRISDGNEASGPKV
jgi:hypothetical protein